MQQNPLNWSRLQRLSRGVGDQRLGFGLHHQRIDFLKHALQHPHFGAIRQERAFEPEHDEIENFLEGEVQVFVAEEELFGDGRIADQSIIRIDCRA